MQLSGAAQRRLKKIRKAKIRHQRGLCHWCRLPMLAVDSADAELRATADHLKPLSRGGKTNWRNLVAAHQRCNQERCVAS
jgi:5-methylcytosine-specific restriction endonuclease McrA